MKNMFKLLTFLYVFCIFNINVSSLNEDLFLDAELDSKMYINPEWIDYIKLSNDEQKNYAAIPEKYIYDYEPKQNILENYNINFFSLDDGLANEEKFTLANIDGKRYVNSSNKDQSRLGLCWAFSSIGPIESNLLINGVSNLENCNINSGSKYCKNELVYINDQKLNDYYINNAISCENGNCLDINGNLIVDAKGNAKKVTIDNTTFSERYIDYIRSKPYTSNAYNNTNGSFTLIDEQYNYYSNDGQIGSGGNYITVGNYLAYGIAPVKMNGIWEKYTINHTTYSLSEVFDSEKSLYQVTNYYIYPSKPSSTVADYDNKLKLWIKELKQNIVKYGSLYVSTGVPDERYGSCFYKDTKNGVWLMNNTGNCNGSGSHALQIIGWDDTYSYAYCKTVNSSGRGEANTNYTKDTCERDGYIWTEGKGAWILKNSWGAGSDLYPYLSYQSTINSLFGVREVSIANFDNAYNEKNSKKVSTSSSIEIDNKTKIETIFTYKKSNKKEYINRVNFYTTSSNTTADIYISNGGDYEYIDTISEIDYSGLYTIDVNNYEVSSDVMSIKIIGPTVSQVNIFTLNKCTLENNCDETPHINSYLDSNDTIDISYFPKENTKFTVYSNTENLNSGTKLNYIIYDEYGNDVSSKFNLNSNYVINNFNIGTVEFVDDISLGKYTLEISIDNIKETIDFNVVDKVKVSLETKYPIFIDDKNIKITPKFSSVEGTTNYNWKSSNSNVATIDNNGNLNILKSGKTTITFTTDTYYGKISTTSDIYIFKKINNIEEFISMLKEGNTRSAYYLTTDLDFYNVNFDDFTETTFNGVFEGNNHVIKNIVKTNTSVIENTGLFNKTASAIIQNLKIIDSTFEGKKNVGSLIGTATTTTIKNVYSNASIVSEYVSGGIIGFSMSNKIYGSYYSGNLNAISKNDNSYAGGIIGLSYNDKVYDSYNEGNIYSETQYQALSVDNNALSIAGGIIGENSNNSKIYNCYNTGKVVSQSNNVFNNIYSNGLVDLYDYSNINEYIYDSYYLYDENYRTNYVDAKRTINELKLKSNYITWDFDDIWYINDNISTPSLLKIPVNANKVTFNIFNNNLNTNFVYAFDYEIHPYSTSYELQIYSEDEELFTIEGNKIITKGKSGTSNIVFKVGNKEFKYPITVKPIIEYSYGKGVTRDEIEVDLNINYYNENTNNSYLKLIYKIGNKSNEKVFDYGIMHNNFKFKIDNNDDIKLELYLCNEECNLIAEESFKIDNIDKEKPEITIESDNTKSTLKINVRDIGISGLSKDNKYEYAISNSNVLAPMVFNTYTPNKVMNNIFMNHYMKYLWVKNISDNVGNKASLNDYIIYNLDIKNVDAEEVVVDIFSDILNYNKEYTFDYEVTPINITNDVIIESSNKELFEIKDNKIITKEKDGTANILFKIGKKEFKYPIIIKDTLKYSYDKNLTNRDISVKIHTNYFEGVLDEFEHLKLIYKIGEKEYVKEFDKNIAINEYEFVVNNNNNINLELYLCNEDCILVNNKNFDIKNIDKEKPIINYVADNINGTLQINIKDIGVSGLNEKNIYKYAISNSDTRTPITSFKEYIPNTEMNNITMNKEYKYLWLYNIGDKVGNKVMDDDYIVYIIDLQAIYYNINYYNNDKSTLLKSEKIKEDDRVIINYKPNNYEDENYIYEFDYWDGFKEGMIATSNINLYAVYKKIPKELYSDLYTIKDGIIKNIKLNDINKEYSVDLFKSNLKYYESYSFYENNNAYITDVKNIKTGMKLKNNLYEYIIVLAGDVTGDGKVKMNDVMKIANHLVNKNVLNDEYLLAGDVTNDDNVKMNDVMKIASSLVNGGSL